MKRINLKPLYTFKVQLGLRVAAFVLAVFAMNFGVMLLALLAPFFGQWSTSLGITAEDKTEIEKMFEKAGTQHKDILKTELDTRLNGMCTAKELETKLEALGLKDDVIKTLTDAVTKQGESLREFIEGKTGKEVKGIEEIMDARKVDIQGLADGTHKSIKIIIPKETVRKTIVERASLTQSTLGYRLPGLGQLDYNNMAIAQLFTSSGISPNSNGVIRYMDQDVVTRNADMRDEKAAAPESAITWVERSATVQKIMDSIPVTKEAFADLEFVNGELNRLLNLNLALKEDQQLYAGTGVAPQLKGISIFATSAQAAMGAAPYVDTVEAANLYDLIAVLNSFIKGGQGKYIPTVVLLNPTDILRYKLLKNTQGQYVLPPFISADGNIIDGVIVKESNQVTVNTLTIGDFRYGTIYTAGGIELDLGYINDQFIKDSMTMKATKRECLLVRTADLGAFKKITDITAALALLETP